MSAVQPESAGAASRRKDLDRSRESALLRRYAESRSPQLREELVRRFTPLARSLAARYRAHREPFDDLLQVANLGLLKAIDGFDPERGRPFVAYATPTILGELRRHFRDHVWTVRLPRSLGETTMRVDGAITELSEALGRYPAPAEIAERLEITIEDVLEALEADHARRTVSLDAPRIGDEESTATVETIGTSEAGYDRVEAQLASEAADIDEREWEVLRMRFGENMSQHEIGSQLGVSQMQVSRISRRALWKLLNAVQGDAGNGEPVPPSTIRPRSQAEHPPGVSEESVT